MKKLLRFPLCIYIISIACSIFLTPTYAQESLAPINNQKEIILEKAEDATKTIWELKNNVEDLKATQDTIEDELEQLKKSTKLGAFFKDDLTSIEVSRVTHLIHEYKQKNTNINKQLLETAEDFKSTTILKQDLLEERKNLYISLVPYIKIEKLEEYKQYIKWDANYLLEKQELSEEIIRKEEVINEKVEKIEWHIEENKKNLETQLYQIIWDKIDEYLFKITQSDKFITLTYEWKIHIIERLTTRLHQKITELRNSSAATTTMLQKIDILEAVFVKKLGELKQEINK